CVGFFVNALPMRTELGGDPSFADVLGRVKETSLGAYAHQEVPFEKLLEELQPERDLRRAPLFQVMFDLQNVPEPEVSNGDVRAQVLEAELGIAKYELTLTLARTPDGLAGALEYNTDLFEVASAHRIAEQYVRLLEQVVEQPEQKMSALRLLDEREEA